MLNIELITKKLKSNIEIKNRIISIKNEYTYLIFVDKFNEEIIKEINKFKELNITIIILTLDIEQPIKSNNIIYLQVELKWYIHTIFRNMFDITCINYFGEKAHHLAKAFNKFSGLTIPIVKEYEELKNMIETLEPSILIKTFDGIGDLLMLVPTIKTWYNKGYKVDVYLKEGRQDTLKNLKEVRNIITNTALINLAKYYKFFDISFRLSDYTQSQCRKHRILTTANLCGLKDEEIKFNKPEIILSQEEIEKGKELIGDYNIVICGESFDNKRTLSENKIQELINNLPLCSIVGTKNKEYTKVNNLTGKLSIRELFSCIYNCKKVITTDTSVIHIAAAFNKPTIFLPSTVNHSWRTYENVVTVIPKTNCYPCNENNFKCNLECLNNIDIKEIIRKI